MAKVRCPVCGATHKHEVEACRMCGYRMNDEIGVLVTGKSGTRPMAGGRSGFGKPMLIAVIAVLAIGIIAVLTGLVASNDQINTVRDQIPGVGRDLEDGWVELSVPDGNYTVEFPQAAEEGELDVGNETLTGHRVELGDVELFVGFGTIEGSDASDLARLQDVAAELWGMPLDELERSEDTEFADLPALITQDDVEVGTGQFNTRTVYLILKGDDLYAVTAETDRDPAAPTAVPSSFDRVLRTLTFTG